METRKLLLAALSLESLLLASAGVGIYTLESPSTFYLYELFGALLGVILTTFGLLRMSDLT
ncbi:MAG: hypothetical protein ABEJ56_01635 [Candidatus Nanohaloarchaea archaeon]